MRVVARRRGGGKTTELIKACAENPNGIIVCQSAVLAQHIKRMADDLGLTIRTPITFHQFLLGDILMGSNLDLYIDNVDLLVINIARGRPIKVMTLTGEVQ